MRKSTPRSGRGRGRLLSVSRHPSTLRTPAQATMFRAAARSLVAPAARRVAFAPAPVRFAAPSQLLAQQRFYAASSLSADSIKARIEDVLKSFEKVDSTKVSISSVACPRHVSPRPESRAEQSRPDGPAQALSPSTESTDTHPLYYKHLAGHPDCVLHQRPRPRLARRRRGGHGHRGSVSFPPYRSPVEVSVLTLPRGIRSNSNRGVCDRDPGRGR